MGTPRYTWHNRKPMPKRKVLESKMVGVEVQLRFEGDVEDAWVMFPSRVDALLDHLQRELAITKRGYLVLMLHITPSSISRCRSGYLEVSAEWLVKMSDYAGIPIEELRLVACLGPVIPPHQHARKQDARS